MLDSSTKRLVLGTPIKEKYHRRGQPTVKADLFSERGAMDVHGSSTSTLVTWVPRLPTRHFRIIHYTFQLVLPDSAIKCLLNAPYSPLLTTGYCGSESTLRISEVPSGYVKIAIENHHFEWENPLSMVYFQ